MRPDEWENNPWHAHMGGESRDCDGRYTWAADYRQTGADGNPQYMFEDDLEFLDILVKYAYYLPDSYSGGSSLEIHNRDNGGYIIRSHRTTDEGYEAMEVTMCQDPTCADEFGQAYWRDHTAEAAGY